MTDARRAEIHALMVRFADGDRAAFDDVFAALWPLVHAFARRALGSAVDADDVAQIALVKIFSRIVDMNRDRDGVAWAFTIAAFETKTALRKRTRSRENPLNSLGDVASTAARQDDVFETHALIRAAQELVGTLSSSDQEALASAFGDDPRPTDDTFRKRRFRALERLRAAWRKVYG